MESDLAQYPVVIEQSVTWGDMDANGHVNNVEYFRYMENARVEYYRRIGKFEVECETGITLILKSATCRYIHPLTYPDRIAVGARIAEMGDNQLVIEYIIKNVEQDRVAAFGDAVIVAVNGRDNTKVPIPRELRDRIRDLQLTGVGPVIVS